MNDWYTNAYLSAGSTGSYKCIRPVFLNESVGSCSYKTAPSGPKWVTNRK